MNSLLPVRQLCRAPLTRMSGWRAFSCMGIRHQRSSARPAVPLRRPRCISMRKCRGLVAIPRLRPYRGLRPSCDDRRAWRRFGTGICCTGTCTGIVTMFPRKSLPQIPAASAAMLARKRERIVVELCAAKDFSIGSSDGFAITAPPNSSPEPCPASPCAYPYFIIVHACLMTVVIGIWRCCGACRWTLFSAHQHSRGGDRHVLLRHAAGADRERHHPATRNASSPWQAASTRMESRSLPGVSVIKIYFPARHQRRCRR